MKNSILQPRTKLVNFRVTDEEYDTLRDASITGGARCLSDFARAAVLQAASSTRAAHAGEPAAVPHMAGLDRRIAAIETEVARLVNRFPSDEPPAVSNDQEQATHK